MPPPGFEPAIPTSERPRIHALVRASTGTGQGVQIRALQALINPLKAELNPICHLLALLGGATIVVVSRLRVKFEMCPKWRVFLNVLAWIRQKSECS